MKTTFIASGDSFITRRIPNDGYEGFDELKCLIEAHDVRFANLESTFHDQEGAPAATSGGTWAMSDPVLLDDMNRYGFNLFNTANNHSGDFGQGGIVATIKHLKERGMIFAGTGMTLQEASGAAYLETKHARVAMIGITSTLDPAAAAHHEGTSGFESASFPYCPSCESKALRYGKGAFRHHGDQCPHVQSNFPRLPSAVPRRHTAARKHEFCPH